MCNTLEDCKKMVPEMFSRGTICVWENTRYPTEKIRTIGRADHEKWVSFPPPSMGCIIHQSVYCAIKESLLDHLALHKDRLYRYYSNCVKLWENNKTGVFCREFGKWGNKGITTNLRAFLELFKCSFLTHPALRKTSDISATDSPSPDTPGTQQLTPVVQQLGRH